MKTFYIYEIPGIKIGCTSDLTKRMIDQGFNDYKILEEHTDIYLASDREIELQKEYKLPVDKIPYYLSIEHRKIGAVMGGRKGGLTHIGKTLSEETKRKISKANKGNTPWNKNTKQPLLGDIHKEKISNTLKNNKEINDKLKEAGRIIGSRPKKEYICSHCNKVGRGPFMFRWHFDNCKHKGTT